MDKKLNFKEIKDFEDYLIDEKGNIFSKKANRYLAQINDKNGYKIVRLAKNNKRQYFRIDLLVAKNYIPNIKNEVEIKHLDLNKENNHVSNLKWISSHQDNINFIKNYLPDIKDFEVKNWVIENLDIIAKNLEIKNYNLLQIKLFDGKNKKVLTKILKS